MSDIRRTVEVKVIAEYWATIELEDSDVNLSREDIEEMAWQEFYEQAHRASIEEVRIKQDLTTCWECETDDVDSEHECEFEEETYEEEEDDEE